MGRDHPRNALGQHWPWRGLRKLGQFSSSSLRFHSAVLRCALFFPRFVICGTPSNRQRSKHSAQLLGRDEELILRRISR
ncbi:hypothetical protein IscW_ISCW011014 [Ixodes scapularis]|uniref:Uncharacterized protein n=1 Tax=Ixodes scapularis TaxID=6945 RepID=B7Q5W4_IXOSC|nr:hypothetical protein IscW_ISCW011014 [Ixodes scapularis]|eukprot:XP_002402369.1 hypothetical protein IscW_ISCW011014 [Ixodes scapularis]